MDSCRKDNRQYAEKALQKRYMPIWNTEGRNRPIPNDHLRGNLPKPQATLYDGYHFTAKPEGSITFVCWIPSLRWNWRLPVRDWTLPTRGVAWHYPYETFFCDTTQVEDRLTPMCQTVLDSAPEAPIIPGHLNTKWYLTISAMIWAGYFI